MWKINNEENKKVLDSIRFEFIEPLFEEVINYKKFFFHYNSIIEYIESKNTLYPNKKKLYLTALGRISKKVRMYTYLDKFCLNNIEYIFKQYYIYLYNNISLDIGNYDIKQFEIDDNLKTIFIDFYYEKFIMDSKIWGLIDSSYSNYNRIVFHKNFCDENGLTVCPYCDIDTLNNIGNREIEHFAPKSKYPFISMHPYNLISSCSSCNKYEGKKTNYYIPIKSPFTIQYGDCVKFNINDANERVSLPIQGIDYIDNYIKLLNLNARYNNKNVYSAVEGRAKSLFQIYFESERGGNKHDEIMFQKYLNYKREPLSFALKSLYESISAYTAYKKYK